jgi:hypothetical protein
MPRWHLVVAALLLSSGANVLAQETSVSVPGAEVYFVSPLAGAHVRGKFTVRFGLKGMGIAPAGVAFPNSGHHHLLINAQALPDLSLPLPSSEQVRHFGKGQSETELELPPGQYSLQLVLGNHLHVPHQPPIVSGTLSITVDD